LSRGAVQAALEPQRIAGTALHLRTPKRTISTLFPLFFYHRNHEAQRSKLFVLPLYYGSWTERRSFHLLFPLVWHSRRVDESATVVFPVYWDFHDRKHTRTRVLFPLLYHHRNYPKQTSSYLLPPGVWLRFRKEMRQWQTG